jgi:hypothetical protein
MNILDIIAVNTFKINVPNKMLIGMRYKNMSKKYKSFDNFGNLLNIFKLNK